MKLIFEIKNLCFLYIFYLKNTKAVIVQSKDAGKHVTSKLVNTTQQNGEKMDQRNCSKVRQWDTPMIINQREAQGLKT